MVKYRSLMSVAALSLMLVACGDKKEEVKETSASENETEEIAQEVTSDETQPITYLGKTYDVPAKVETVIAASLEAMEDAAVLGVKPAGVISNDGTTIPNYLAEDLAGATVVGSKKEPSPEAMLALNPDVILGTSKWDEAPPLAGFPVVFVLDGTRYSILMQETLTNQLRNRPKTGVEPAIIVGIGHHEADIPNQRFYDFTAPATSYQFPVRRGKEMTELPAGGAQKFMSFIVEQLIPMLKEKYPINEAVFALYGHSLGGLFVLWSYLTHPTVFSKYVALSPSIWWNGHEILEKLHVAERILENSLYIAVGGDEGDMVEDAGKFAQLLQQKVQHITYYVAQHENHASIIPTTMSQVQRFLKQS